ncbi:MULTISPECIES: hypothetical protein [unclassified Gilliamella]|uniref:hypothetical protein n=1 Tax=unclassified Gilliamella TaxID=2685620 RepID=UPI00226A3753|nr:MULTISPECIES: hypothetical protein [unclassified Gilliamella]MCX8601621.1 hypothetical protein [Gilliamella sp. B3722]MCX8608543.1 hypothetical protein [Gilliamella sp. B3771]MCX8610884.1 hypothetical protein [Gilliamella sp. B3891]MCX8613352.1 hypothetical protein [Gilliamella sp. B3773]MCX8615195.1 hypothetical protein [Gilliamella sp. B3770]
MPNENTQKCKVFTAQTSKLENGEVAVEEIILQKEPTPLFVLFAYGGRGAPDFEKAAKHKRSRLLKKYPDAEVRIIEGFLYPNEFKAEWTKLYNELTNSETACKYALWQVHYFGHGGPDKLSLKGEGNDIYFNEKDNMELLPWHPNEGIMVLHSCRGGAYEDLEKEKQRKAQKCLANVISMQQETRCLGQVTYASFAGNIGEYNDNYIVTESGGMISSTNSLLDSGFYKYRPERKLNSVLVHITACALWGYALFTGDTHKKTLARMKEYKNRMIEQEKVKNPIYPIYEEIKKLAPKNQILPCRVFNKGKLEERIVEVDVFNQNDLEYL